MGREKIKKSECLLRWTCEVGRMAHFLRFCSITTIWKGEGGRDVVFGDMAKDGNWRSIIKFLFLPFEL